MNVKVQGIKGVSAKGRKNLKPDAETSLISISPRFMTTRFGSRSCHPEPGFELASGSNDFGISPLGLENLGFKTL